MRRAPAAALAVLAIAAVAYVRGCAGPRPKVIAAALDASPSGLVPRATLRNEGGEGEVEVRFRVRELATGRVIGAEGRARLERGEELDVRSPEPVPPGDYALEVEAEYPPR